MSEHPLENIDLGVVAAPRAPVGFADGVLARFATTEAAIAVEKQRRARRATWMIGGAVAAIAAVLALVLAWPRDRAAGSISTDEPRTVALGDVRAELAAHAQIEWRREGTTLRVEQRGTVTWNVPAGQHLHITGAAPVDATNATLRVEVQMNADRKTVGSAAAMVAAVTVAVLAGKATLGDHTVDAGKAAMATPGKQVMDLVQTDDRVAIVLVYPANEAWLAGGHSIGPRIQDIEHVLSHLDLPLGSTVGAVMYANGADSAVQPKPSGTYRGDELGDPARYHDKHGSDLVAGIQAGVDMASTQHAGRRLVVVVGDGNDTDRTDAAKASLLKTMADAEQRHVTVKAVLVREPSSGKPSLIEAVGLDSTDATNRSLLYYLRAEIGLPPPQRTSALVVYAGRGTWMTKDLLDALGAGLEGLQLPPGSELAAVEYSTGATIRVPWEPAPAFKAAQLGDVTDYADHLGSDVVQGVVMGLAELSKQTLPRKTLVVVGDGNDTNKDPGLALGELADQAKRLGIVVHVINVRGPDSPEGSVLGPLDPHPVTAAGTGPAQASAVRSILDAIR